VPSATSTLGIIERIRRGDQEAFTVLFNRTALRLAARIHYQLSPEMRGFYEIDDLIQETYLRAVQDLSRFEYRAPGSFLRWICAIADHVIADRARFEGRQKRQATQLLRYRSPSNPAGPEPVNSLTPSRILASEEKFRALISKLEILPENCRSVFLLAKLEGLSTREIAEKLSIHPQQVSLLLHRAVKKLQQALHSLNAHG
jgi:RNA polymerase sigma-70 factor, ECF subfamily